MIQLPPYALTEDDQQSIYDYTIPLGADTYRVVLKFRTRQDRWYIYLYKIDNTPLVLGEFMAVDIFLFANLQIEGMPEGKLMLYDTSGAGLECGWADLGNRCELLYLDPADLPDAPDPPDVIVTGSP